MAGLVNRLLLDRLRRPGAVERVLRERLSEPLHMNVLSIFVALFGSLRWKIAFDLVFRQYTAFCLYEAATRAKAQGLSEIKALEFGVASGAGLLNMCKIAERVKKATGVTVTVHGFDTASGLPPVRDYRDHPELYAEGDYVMPSSDDLIAKLPPFAELIVGPIAETVETFRESVSPSAPIGYVSLDVDYYFSSVDALKVFEGPAEAYLPFVNMYLDDTHDPHHSPSAGELLAIAEFNAAHPMRHAHPYTALRDKRIFKNAAWISKIYAMHIHDHPLRNPGNVRKFSKQIANPELSATNLETA